MKRSNSLAEAMRDAGITVRPRWQRMINAPAAWVLLFVRLLWAGTSVARAASLATQVFKAVVGK